MIEIYIHKFKKICLILFAGQPIKEGVYMNVYIISGP